MSFQYCETHTLFPHLTYQGGMSPEYTSLDRPEAYQVLLTKIAATQYPWLILTELKQLITQLIDGVDHNLSSLFCDHSDFKFHDIAANCLIEKGATIESFVTIKGPAYISAGSTIRSGAYLRGGVFLGPHSLVGHSTEVKHSIFLSSAKAAHHCYVGDSIIGQKVNLGAGTTTGNVRFDKKTVVIRNPSGDTLSTKRNKLGAFFGDHAQTGCQVITNPGTIIPAHAWIKPGLEVKHLAESARKNTL
ncbi:MAG: UDP-N-acetylglucosamine diphosphorylase [Proteobacteria bacterium]|nr:UDP-N-acetylglucosamine diphosphorylase [Pseudomonadota bacterium]